LYKLKSQNVVPFHLDMNEAKTYSLTAWEDLSFIISHRFPLYRSKKNLNIEYKEFIITQSAFRYTLIYHVL